VLTIDRVHEDQREAELLVFDPGNVPKGLETSDDPILKFRSKIYSESFARRSHETRTTPAPKDMGQ
jgi:catalase